MYLPFVIVTFILAHAKISVEAKPFAGVESKQTGICSWYEAEVEIPSEWPIITGDVFDRHDMAMTAAHKTLPFGTKIRVLNPLNQKTVDVRVNNRGPYAQGRILDLTYEAFGLIVGTRALSPTVSYTFV